VQDEKGIVEASRLYVESLKQTLPLPVGPENKAGQSMRKGQDHISEYRNPGIAESYYIGIRVRQIQAIPLSRLKPK
jgi:hypothetical protein